MSEFGRYFWVCVWLMILSVGGCDNLEKIQKSIDKNTAAIEALGQQFKRGINE